jgi:hypothetical protein
MPKKDKSGILDLETASLLSKSATIGQLQWIWKLVQEKKLERFGLRSKEDEKDKAEFDRTWEQYLAFGSALRLNEDDDPTFEDAERCMKHFIKAWDSTFYAQGIKGLDRGNYKLDDEVAFYIKESFERYLENRFADRKKGDLEKAFRTNGKRGVKKKFPSALSGYVPDVIQKIMNEFMDKDEVRIGKPSLNITNVIESYSTSEDIKLSTLKDWWKEYQENALVYFEMQLAFDGKDFTETHVKQIREHFIEDFRK